MQNLKTDKIITFRFMQPDSTTFNRHKSLWLILTDEKEYMTCPRYAFLKISKKRFAAHLPVPTHGLSPLQAKEQR